MTGIYSRTKIVPIAEHDPAKFPKRLFAQNEDGSLSEVEKKVSYKVERYIDIYSGPVQYQDKFRMRLGSVDNRPLFVEVE